MLLPAIWRVSLDMLRWTLLSIATLFFSLGLLTVFRSPDWSIWQLALLAGEFGHWLALGALMTVVAGFFVRGSPGVLSVLTTVFGLGGVLLLLKPALSAPAVADFARRDLDHIGAPQLDRAAFSWSGFWRAAPGPVPIETMSFAPELSLDYYRAVGRSHAPCVIVVHGGGWDSGSRDQLTGLNHWLARHGYSVAAISYRLAPKFPWPAPREDTGAAIAFLKANAERLGLDPERLVLLGRSAGGQIAEVVAYSAHDPSICGVVGLYAPSDINFAYKYARDNDVLKSPGLIRRFIGGAPMIRQTGYDDASALQHVTPAAPPTLLIHGENDTLVWHRHSVRLEAVLERAGVPCVFVSLPWATHAFEYNLAGPGGQLATYALERFLGKVTAVK
ncbi:MAG: alpha/beta hydrolase [Opitutus sp.]